MGINWFNFILIIFFPFHGPGDFLFQGGNLSTSGSFSSLKISIFLLQRQEGTKVFKNKVFLTL